MAAEYDSDGGASADKEQGTAPFVLSSSSLWWVHKLKEGESSAHWANNTPLCITTSSSSSLSGLRFLVA